MNEPKRKRNISRIE